MLLSVNPGPWCTSPLLNKSRRWRALCTGWLPPATETHYSPAPEEEQGSTGGPSTHWNQKHTCKQRGWAGRHRHEKQKLLVIKDVTSDLFIAAGSPAQTPEGEAQATVGVQTDGNLPRRVELTLQFDGATQGTGGSVRHLKEQMTDRDIDDASKLSPAVKYYLRFWDPLFHSSSAWMLSEVLYVVCLPAAQSNNLLCGLKCGLPDISDYSLLHLLISISWQQTIRY